MTTSKRESVLQALQAALEAYLPLEAVGERNLAVPSRIPPCGFAILRDGDPGEPEVTMSPLAYHYAHRAEVDLLVDGEGVDRDQVFDLLARGLGAAIAADRTLGGLCDWAEAEAPAPLHLVIEGADGIKAATIPVVLHYTSADPLL